MSECELKEEALKNVDENRNALLELSREIHGNPEPAFKEFKSARIVSSFLEKWGFEIERGVGGLETAFRATAIGSKGSPIIAFMAEYDAVPGLGHGCGHNISCMASVGAGIAVSKLFPKLKGSVIVIGTPAEEGTDGKRIMVENGAFRDIDVAMMVHACNYTKISHEFIAGSGYRFHFIGKTAHACTSPHDGLNALDAVVLTYEAIGLLRQHIKGDYRIQVEEIATNQGVLNMIPEKASCAVVVRAPTEVELVDLVERVHKCAQSGAAATGCQLETEQILATRPHFKHNQVLEEIFLRNLEAQGIVEEYPIPVWVVSTDACHVSQIIPTLHPMIAICRADVEPHTEQFLEASNSPRGEETFLSCAKAMATTAVEILGSPEKMEKIRKGL